GHRDRPRAGADDGAGCLGNGHRSAGVGTEMRVAAVAVNTDRDALRRSFDARNRGVRAGGDHSVREDALVVLAVDPALRGDVRRAERTEEVGVWCVTFGCASYYIFV